MTGELPKAIHHVAVPRICNRCFQRVVRTVLDDSKVRILADYCPHFDTLAYAQIETVEGKRGIVRWQLQGPIPQSMAVESIKEMGEQYGVELKELAGARLH